MIPLSTRAREAIKTGLAMTIAYGLALSLGWMQAYWAGFAVAVISLPTAGQSLIKGANRIMGTIAGCIAALFIMGLFPQQRFAFMGVLSIYIGICTWMMTGERRQYFWNVAGFVALIICVIGPGAEKNFDRAVDRTLATALGIAVYTGVSVFLWPQTSAKTLHGTAASLMETHAQLFGIYKDLLVGRPAEFVELRSRLVRLLQQLVSTFQAAGSESYEVREVAHLWSRLRQQSEALMEAMEVWREGFREMRGIDLKKLLPAFDPACLEVEQRFRGIVEMLNGKPAEQIPKEITLQPVESEMERLSHFERAAVEASVHQFRRIAKLTGSLYGCVEDLQGFKVDTHPKEPEVLRSGVPVFDLERVRAVIMVLATLWIAFFVWVYIDPPGHSALLQMAPTLAFSVALMPQIRVQKLFIPLGIASVSAGIIYVLIMPALTGYIQLGTLIFTVWFLLYYALWKPEQGLMRLILGVSFLTFATIQNQQTYDFAAYANKVAFLMISFLLIAVTSNIPFSRLPEKTILQLLTRFSRSIEFLLLRMTHRPRPDTLRERLRVAFHRHEVATLPGKLWSWSRALDYSLLGATTPEQVRDLLTSLHALSFRLNELMESRAQPQSDRMVDELVEDLRVWRTAVQTEFHAMAMDQKGTPTEALRAGFDRLIEALEGRIRETLDKEWARDLEAKHRQNFYRLLGSSRGFTEAALAYSGLCQRIDWERWREARF